MSNKCDRKACILRLERIAASATLLAADIKANMWYDQVVSSAAQIHNDAQVVHEQIVGDKSWEAGDR